MEQLVFTNNWNRKLDCDVFSTIRLRNDKRYFAGAEFEVILKQGNRQVNKGKHRILGVRYLLLNELDGYTCLMDTGYSAADTKDIIRNMYSKMSPAINWNKQQLVVALLKKDRDANNKLQFNEP